MNNQPPLKNGDHQPVVVFAVAAAGQAEYLAPVIKALGCESVSYTTGAATRVFARHGIESHDVLHTGQEGYKAFAMDTLKGMKCALVVAGANIHQRMDMDFMLAAKELAIPVLSIIDHSCWYSDRFKRSDGTMVLPDYIFVNELTAKQEAVEDGIAEEILYVMGNPVMELTGMRIRNPKPRSIWLDDLGLPDKKIVVFVSEPYRKFLPKGSQRCVGFDEYEVLDDLLSVVMETHKVLIKLHPEEEPDKYLEYGDATVVKDTDMSSLILNADFFVGMGSTLLLEAAMHRDDVLSYRPNQRIEFLGNRTGVTFQVEDRQQLGDILRGELKVKARNSGVKGCFEGSIERITRFIEDISR
jgi:hypothetical protein